MSRDIIDKIDESRERIDKLILQSSIRDFGGTPVTLNLSGFSVTVPPSYIGTEIEEELRNQYALQRLLWEPNISEMNDIGFILASYMRATGKRVSGFSDTDLTEFMNANKIKSFRIITEGEGDPPYRYTVERFNIDIKIYGVKIIRHGKEETHTVEEFLRLFYSFFPAGKDKLFSNQTVLTASGGFGMVPQDVKVSITAPENSNKINELINDEARLSRFIKYGEKLNNGVGIFVSKDATTQRAKEILRSFNKPINRAYYKALYREATIKGEKITINENEYIGVKIDAKALLSEVFGYAMPSNKYAEFETFLSDFGNLELETVLRRGGTCKRKVKLLSNVSNTSPIGGQSGRGKSFDIILPDSMEYKIIGSLTPIESLRLAKDSPERAEFYDCLLISYVSNMQKLKSGQRWIKFKFDEVKSFYRMEKTAGYRQFKSEVKEALNLFVEKKMIEKWELRDQDYIITFPDWQLYDNRKPARNFVDGGKK